MQLLNTSWYWCQNYEWISANQLIKKSIRLIWRVMVHNSYLRLFYLSLSPLILWNKEPILTFICFGTSQEWHLIRHEKRCRREGAVCGNFHRLSAFVEIYQVANHAILREFQTPKICLWKDFNFSHVWICHQLIHSTKQMQMQN